MLHIHCRTCSIEVQTKLFTRLFNNFGYSNHAKYYIFNNWIDTTKTTYNWLHIYLTKRNSFLFNGKKKMSDDCSRTIRVFKKKRLWFLNKNVLLELKTRCSMFVVVCKQMTDCASLQRFLVIYTRKWIRATSVASMDMPHTDLLLAFSIVFFLSFFRCLAHWRNPFVEAIMMRAALIDFRYFCM